MEPCFSKSTVADDSLNWNEKGSKDEFRVRREALLAVLESCQKALELMGDSSELDGNSSADRGVIIEAEEDDRLHGSLETDVLYEMVKSQVIGPEFLHKIENARASAHLNSAEEVSSSWDIVHEKDFREGENWGLEQEDYVFVRQEDIVEGITSFMAAYLLSLEKTKDLTPDQLQEALGKTLFVNKRKGKLRKAWEGSKVIYNVASWSATAIGIYQNPVIFRVVSSAIWTSCRVLSKLL